MMIYSDLENVRLHHTAVALGKFDGMHKGHQLLFDKLASYKARGLMTVIFTFSFHPASLLTGKRQQVIYTREEKRRILSTFGADVLVEFPFTKETAHMLPGDFIKNVLVDTLGAQAVVVGNDFHFGYQRSGDVAFLRENAEKYAYTVDSQEKVCFEGAEISATRIREEISQGNMEEAYEMLGRRYSVSGVVVHGKGNGRTIDMPTANLIPESEKLLPPDGVYVSRTRINDLPDAFDSVTNIGTNPTVGANNLRSIETFLLNFDGNLYGQNISVELYKKLRDEETFSSLSTLKAQMKVDIMNAEDYLRSLKK